MPSDRTGLLIIRAWAEEGSTKPLRAQVRVTDDVSNGMEPMVTLVDVADVADLVDAWLRRVSFPNGEDRASSR